MECRVSGCSGRSSRFGQLCSAHRSRDRRHGDPEQISVTVAELKPHLKAVRDRMVKNADKPLWPMLEARWGVLMDNAQGTLGSRQQGRVGQRHQTKAAQELVKLGGEVDAREVAEMIGALYLLADYKPERFKTDRAFMLQLVRRVRSLTDVNAGEYFDHKTGKQKRVYRDVSPKAAEVMGAMLVEVFGVVGLQLAKLEREDGANEEKARADYQAAVGELS
jgi:hypothetical protein